MATLGPGQRHAGGARRAAARRRRRRAPQPQPRHARRAHRPAATRSARQPSAPARWSPCSPTCPGRRCAPAPFPDGGVDAARRVALVSLVPERGVELRRPLIGVDYPTLLDDLHAGDRVVLGDGAITLRVERVAAGGAPSAGATRRACAGSPRRAPAVASACGSTHRPPRTSRWPRRWRPRASTSSPSRSSAPPTTCARSATRSRRRRRAWSPRSRRCRRSTTSTRSSPTSDAVMVARGDLGIECPLEDVPHLQKRIIRSCVERRRAGDHRDADDGEHDHRPVADARRGQRRRQRGVRRHRRADAVGRDRDRRRPGQRRAHDGRVAERAETRASYAQWADRLGRAAAARAGRTVPIGSRWRSRTPPDWPRPTSARTRSCAAPDRVAPRWRWPGSVRRPPDRPVARPGRRCARLALSWGVTPLQVDTYATTDDLVWFAVETAVHSGCHSGRPCWCSPARPTAPSGASHRRVAHRPRRMNALWSEEAGRCRSSADRARPRLDGSLGRDVEAQSPARRATSACCATTAAATAGRSRTPVRSRWTRRSTISSGVLAGRRAVLVGHSYGGDVALATADRHPDLVAGVAVYETPLSWLPWWPNTTAGSIAVAEQRARGRPPSSSCNGSSGPDVGRRCRRTHEETRRAEASRSWANSRICGDTNRGMPSTSRCR